MNKAFPALLLLLALGSRAQAEVVITKLDHVIPDLRAVAAAPVPTVKVDSPAELFLIPYFEVDTTNPASGNTTLIAVRNTTDGTRPMQLEYRHPDGSLMVPPLTFQMSAKRVLTFNLRDAGLPPGGDGFVRGHARVIDTGAVVDPTVIRTLTADYYLVDDANNFAFGERAVNLTADDPQNDLCQRFEARFTRGGAFEGTQLFVYAVNPQGSDPFADPATLIINSYNEAGTLEPATFLVHTDNNTFTLDAADITDFLFGAFEIMFNGTEGHVTVSTKALGKFSGGFNAACTEP